MNDEPHKPGAQHHDKSPEELAKEAAAKRRDEILQKVLKSKKGHQQDFHQNKGASSTSKSSPALFRRGPRGG
jgi:hypothetical protein